MANTQVAEQPPKQLPKLETGGKIAPIVPRNVDELARMASMIFHGGAVPNSYEGKSPDETRAKLMIGIAKGAEVGLGPLTALQWIAVINNRPTIWGDGAVALVHASGHLEKMEVVEIGAQPGDADELNLWPDSFGIEARLYRKGHGEPYVGRFTVADAKRAHLWMNARKQPWMLYPRRMLRWRAMGFAIREGFADCLAGMMIREEVEDIPALKDVTPKTDFLDDGLEIAGPNEAIEAAEKEASDPEPVEAPEGCDWVVPVEHDDKGTPQWDEWAKQAASLAAQCDDVAAFWRDNEIARNHAPPEVLQAVEKALMGDQQTMAV